MCGPSWQRSTTLERTGGERVVVYTAVVGREESVPPVGNPDSRLTYLLFTDGVITAAPPPWQLRTIPSLFRDPARDSRRPKLLPHLFLPDFDISLWVDATVDILDFSAEKVVEL